MCVCVCVCFVVFVVVFFVVVFFFQIISSDIYIPHETENAKFVYALIVSRSSPMVKQSFVLVGVKSRQIIEASDDEMLCPRNSKNDGKGI